LRRTWSHANLVLDPSGEVGQVGAGGRLDVDAADPVVERGEFVEDGPAGACDDFGVPAVLDVAVQEDLDQGTSGTVIAAVELLSFSADLQRLVRGPWGAGELAFKAVEELLGDVGTGRLREDESEVAVGGWCDGQAPGVPGVGSSEPGGVEVVGVEPGEDVGGFGESGAGVGPDRERRRSGVGCHARLLQATADPVAGWTWRTSAASSGRQASQQPRSSSVRSRWGHSACSWGKVRCSAIVRAGPVSSQIGMTCRRA
jgi:hypothetical protein